MGKQGNGRKSERWRQEHARDPFVRQARHDGLRSRAVYKLMEIDRRDSLLRPGQHVLELGAAPGGWTEYVAAKVGPTGRVVATDILPMDAPADVAFVQGDFTENAIVERLDAAIGGTGVDLVLSDMAPNLSGIAVSDQARAMGLAELALDMAERCLREDGRFLVKLFQGAGYDVFVKTLRERFRHVGVRKPEASRARSREVYVLAGVLV